MNVKAIAIGFSLFMFGLSLSASAQNPLPSWNRGATKKVILEFVTAVTDKDGKDYVKPADRIAVFDNDGMLRVEQPMYTQIAFIFDRVKELAPRHPEWKTAQSFNALLEGDLRTVMASGEGRRLGLFVHHTDAERDFGYDRKSDIGTLDKVLDMAADND